MIQCNNLCKNFGDNPVLKDINLTINEGEIFGLLGPSGAGKTTLIRILTGQIPFEQGRVCEFSKDIRDINGKDRKKIGIMMDQLGVYERLTCMNNLKVYADLYQIPHSSIKPILDYVGLGECLNQKASELSKGMLARLKIARAIINHPQIIFLDEPTSGLDPKNMKNIHKLIAEMKNNGCTIFLTTHNMEEAATLCDRVALLHEGQIVETGDPKAICRKHNMEKKIKIHTVYGEDILLTAGSESADRINQLMQNNEIETIHSSEPDLRDIFLKLTGKQLEEE